MVDFPNLVFAAPTLVVSYLLTHASTTGTAKTLWLLLTRFWQVQTTLGRMQCFGSFILPRLVGKNIYNWVFLGSRGSILALYYENLPSGSVITKLGIIGDGVSPMTTPLTPHYHVCDFPVIASPNAGLFLSVAVLSGLQKVDLCRIENRCTGILMRYNSGLTLVLGQWHVPSVSQHSCIYDSPTEYTANICFRLTALKRHKIVTSIMFSEDSGESVVSDPECQVFSPGTVMLSAHNNIHFANILYSIFLGGSQNSMMKSCLGEERFMTFQKRAKEAWNNSFCLQHNFFTDHLKTFCKQI